MFRWLKLITQGGRQDFVREIAHEYLTQDKVAELVSQGVSALLEKACAGIDDKKMEKICGYCSDGAELFGAIAEAVKDKQLTNDEAVTICGHVFDLTGTIVTKERVDAVIEKLVEKVP